MRRSGRRNRRGSIPRILIFICVAAGFAALWFGAEAAGRLADWFRVDREQTEQLPSMMGQVVEGLPKNSYDLSCFSEQGGFMQYSGKQASRTGIDVSSHQGAIDWAAVAADGVEYAMIRVGYRGYTDGAISMDELFRQNVADALANGLDVGVYFFSQAITPEEAEQEAQTVLSAISGLNLTYPVIFDWENIEDEARTDGMDSVTLTACAEAFCTAVEQAGYPAGIYFNQAYGYQEYDLLTLKDRVFWLAQYDSAPSFYYDFQMWQYTNAGTVNGIEGAVDLNLSFWQQGN